MTYYILSIIIEAINDLHISTLGYTIDAKHSADPITRTML